MPSPTLPRKALIAVTSATQPLHNNDPTGLFITEALHPYLVLTAAGFSVTLASETGSYTPDTLSLTPDFLHGEDKAIYDDPASAFRKQLDNMPKASEVDEKEYGLFFASAGHAALYDFPTAGHLQRVASDVWKRGGVVAVVCHGAAILPGVLVDGEKGEHVAKGRKVTGFTREAEYDME